MAGTGRGSWARWAILIAVVLSLAAVGGASARGLGTPCDLTCPEPIPDPLEATSPGDPESGAMIDPSTQQPNDADPTMVFMADKSSAAPLSPASPVTVDVAPPASQSWYVYASEIKNPATALFRLGANAPTIRDQTVILGVGAWCPSNSRRISLFIGTGCSDPAGDSFNVAFALEYFLQGYESVPAHRQLWSLRVVVGTNNSIAGTSTSNARWHGQYFENALHANLISYARSLNTYNHKYGYPLHFYVQAGNDIETQWGGPNPAVAWVDGFNSVDTTANIALVDFGDYFGTCASLSCWNSVVDHGWTTAQKYYTNWGAVHDIGYPEIYNTSWPIYYADLNAAARSAGTLVIGVPYWLSVTWSCGVGGATEPSPAQAWTDFTNIVGQRPTYTTYLHALARNC